MKKGKIKIILEDHWHGFLKIYENKIRSNVKKEVEKILQKDWKYTGLDAYVGASYYIDKKAEESFASIKRVEEL